MNTDRPQRNNCYNIWEQIKQNRNYNDLCSQVRSDHLTKGKESKSTTNQFIC